ncbi:MAG: transcriptional regulator GcvA [Alphaproteobacteria bacterium]
MVRRLPSLNALRAFEAAARHLSFSRAADELNVTKAAVSHQVKALEEELGLPLFRRLNRALLLTDAGQTLLPSLTQAFGMMGGAIDRLKKRDETGELTLTTLASFAAIWLVPRLGRFRRAHPEIDVRITTSDESIDFAASDVDLAIRYGAGRWPNVHVERLMTEEIFPVCAPSLLADGPPLEKPADLANHTLLHDYTLETWRMWLIAVGEGGVDAERGPRYQHSNLVIQAAEQGDGVALARSVLAADALAKGRLVKPFDVALPAEFAYYLVCPPDHLKRPKVKAFRAWLVDEAAESVSSLDPMR